MIEQAPQKQLKIWPVFRVFTRAAFAFPVALTLLIVCMTLIQIAGLIAPLFLRDFINELSTVAQTPASLPHLFLLLGFFGGVQLFSWFMRRVEMDSATRLELGAMANLTREAYTYLAEHSYEFFTNNFVGTLTRRVTRYARVFEPFIDNILTNIYPTLLYATGVIIILSLRNIWLGMGLLVWCVLFLTIQFYMTKWRYHFKVKRSLEESRLTGALSDSIGNYSSVITFGAQKQEARTLEKVITSWRDASTRSWNADSASYALQFFLVLVVQVGILAAGVWLWSRQLLTLGDMVLIQIYIVTLTQNIAFIGSNVRQLFDAFADAYEMIEILETPHAVQDKPNAGRLSVPKGAIDFSAVDFSFGTTTTVLENFELHVPSGQKVALVGPSGAGKSTVTKLLLRLYDVGGGSLTIDGTDVRDVTQASLRKNIGFVPQEPVLFHRSLAENIRYGKPDASMEEVISAARRAHCHDFISKLPEKYETLVGERGVKLSGGERQRVAIARAILKNAPILVLDEATSALDSESEHLIQDALQTLMRGKTVIVIAHRLSTIMKMDRIVVIEDGRIVSDGTHDELLSQESNLYKKLWSIQAGSFITETESA